MPVRTQPVWLLALMLVALLVSKGFVQCGSQNKRQLGAGFRYSSYGPPYDPGPEYWARVGTELAARFDGAAPQAIWIVGIVSGKGTFLNFPAGDVTDRLIQWKLDDDNEQALALFDELGVQVWLQVEPGEAAVEELIHIMLNH